MIRKPDREPYILFDLNGQNVGVIDANIDDNGELQCTWVCLDKDRRFTNEEIELMLKRAFQDLLRREAAKDKKDN